MIMSSNKLFVPFRAVGLCCNSVPLSVSANGTSILIGASIGKSFHVYNGDKIHLLFASAKQENDIHSLIQDKSITYISCGSDIKSFKRGHHVWSINDNDGQVLLILVIGEHLVSINSNNILKIWNRLSIELYSEIEFPRNSFSVTSIVHPSTYLNKVLIGSQQGSMQLWNIRIGKLVYHFNGWNSSVLTLVQSPALDVIGVGLANGTIIMHNIKCDNELMSFTQDLGPVTGIAFRTDGVNKMMSCSDKSGNIAVWNLDLKRLDNIIVNAHVTAVDGVVCLPGQPLMITASRDNCIKIWIFDNSDGSARLLKHRTGHSAPPTIIRFINNSSLISGGSDNTLRVISLHKDSQSREMSKGGLHKRCGELSPVSDLSFELIRRYEWDSILTCHHGNHLVHTWNLSRYCIGSHSLKPKGHTPLSCCISACGNYAILGINNGNIEIFNIQSGLRKKIMKSSGDKGPVRGVAINNLCNEVYSCGSDGFIKVWSFYDTRMITTINVEVPLSKMCYHRNSSLLAVCTDLCDIIICDMDTKKLVRQFKGHTKRITDMCFTSNGRWLLSCSMDCTIRTWDIPTGHLIDSMIIPTPPTSITITDNGEYIACSVVDELGIYIWINTSLYMPISLHPVQYGAAGCVSDLPSTTDGSMSLLTTANDISPANVIINPLSKGLITLSSLPKAQWVNLYNLDIIRERNRPTEPVKPVKPAPFFIPTVPGLETNFEPMMSELPEKENNQASRIIEMNKMINNDSLFQQQLLNSNSENISILLKSFGPSQLDKEIQLLNNSNHITAFLKFLLYNLKNCCDFELTESYLVLYLKYHRQITDCDSHCLLEEINTEHRKLTSRLQKQFDYVMCLLAYTKHFSV